MTENANVTPSEMEMPDTGIHLEKPGIYTLFPTPLFSGTISEPNLCDSLAEELIKMKTAEEGFFEAGNFTTDDNLHGRIEFVRLSELVLKETNKVLDFLSVIRDNHYISGMWGNITNPNHRHPVHIHPNSLLSGIIYLKTPEKCGGTVFTDPRPAARVFEPDFEKMSEFNSGRFVHPAEKGKMLIWQSWMTHGVERGFTIDEDQDRIVISFNIQMIGKIQNFGFIPNSKKAGASRARQQPLLPPPASSY
jgi:uncharacterized protein (TIGR02466 family)